MDTGKWIAVGLLAFLFAVGIYDVTALCSDGKYSTITTWIVLWSRRWPFLPFAAGVICGHLFFPADQPAAIAHDNTAVHMAK